MFKGTAGRSVASGRDASVSLPGGGDAGTHSGERRVHRRSSGAAWPLDDHRSASLFVNGVRSRLRKRSHPSFVLPEPAGHNPSNPNARAEAHGRSTARRMPQSRWRLPNSWKQGVHPDSHSPWSACSAPPHAPKDIFPRVRPPSAPRPQALWRARSADITPWCPRGRASTRPNPDSAQDRPWYRRDDPYPEPLELPIPEDDVPAVDGTHRQRPVARSQPSSACSAAPGAYADSVGPGSGCCAVGAGIGSSPASTRAMTSAACRRVFSAVTNPCRPTRAPVCTTYIFAPEG